MAVTLAFTTENTVVTVNGRQITDWGNSESPISEAQIDQKRTLVRGLGGNATVLERKNPGKRVTLSVRAGSPDSAFLQGLFLGGTAVTYTRTQIGSIETAVGTEGVVTTIGDKNRGGADSVSDDTYTIEFNAWDEMAGGK